MENSIGGILLKVAAAIVGINCGSDKELPTLATGEEGDAAADASEVEAAVSSGDTANGNDVSAVKNDTPQGVDSTSTDQAEEETTAAPTDKFICMVTAEDCYGMGYGMEMESEDYATYSGGSFTGIMRFKAALGTAAGLEEERRAEPASQWMQEGMTVPGFAQNLTGRYDISVDPSSGLLTCLNLDADSGVPQDATLFPMTWLADESKLNPEPISADAHNEVYIAMKPGLEMAIECSDEDCSVLSGTANVDIGDNPTTYGCPDSTVELAIKCEKISE